MTSRLALARQDPLRVVVAHNYYQQRGGEDAVVESEVELLRQHGHEVRLLVRHNDAVRAMSKTRLASATIWNHDAAREFSRLAQDFMPDVLHVHNFFPLLSPSIHWQAQRHGIPVVQTLHNYRLLCPQAMLFRKGEICEDCIGSLPWRGVVRACYRDSSTQSAVVASMLALHRAIGTWQTKVDRFIALTEFGRRKFIDAGLPAARVVAKPNFVNQPAPQEVPRRGFLFAGRLSPEKGIPVLLAAIERTPAAHLRIAGTGPLADSLRHSPRVELLGQLTPDQLREEMQRAAALVVPSLWYEAFGRVIVEAYAAGTPVIASDVGGLGELVEEGSTGCLFRRGEPDHLAQRLRWFLEHDDEAHAMGRRARAVYEARYSADTNYRALVDIYSALPRSRQQLPASS